MDLKDVLSDYHSQALISPLHPDDIASFLPTVAYTATQVGKSRLVAALHVSRRFNFQDAFLSALLIVACIILPSCVTEDGNTSVHVR